MEIRPYKNRQGMWTASVIISKNIENACVPTQRRMKVKPHNSFRELMEYLSRRIVDDGRICVLHDSGVI